jgi:hypothetical protein
MNPEQPLQDPNKPVAYDADGQPLYAAPQNTVENGNEYYEPRSHVTSAPETAPGYNYDPRIRAQYGNEPRVVHQPRPYEPKLGEISEELRQKHDASQRRYPNLNLSEAEYVILDIKRHPIGLLIPVVSTIFLIIVLLAGLISYPMIVEPDPLSGAIPGLGLITTAVLCLILLIGIGGYIAVWVYLKNTFYLTNESVVQEIQHSIFSKHEQTVSLGSIEDASFKQNGILPSLLNYGTIRLSTEGEETTYSFLYVTDPKRQIATVNNAIESFKNGRPVGDD